MRRKRRKRKPGAAVVVAVDDEGPFEVFEAKLKAAFMSELQRSKDLGLTDSQILAMVDSDTFAESAAALEAVVSPTLSLECIFDQNGDKLLTLYTQSHCFRFMTVK